MNEDFAVVGSFYIDDQRGACYIYQRNGSDWDYLMELQPEQTESGDWFGLGMSMSDDYLVVGAPKDHWVTPEVGKVYVYAIDDGDFTLDGVLEVSSIYRESGFGLWSTIIGDEIIVSAPDYDFSIGGVVTFKKIDGEWVQSQEIRPNGEIGEDLFFGRCVSADNNWLAISANKSVSPNIQQKVYMYERLEEEWSLVDILDVEGENASIQAPGYSVDLVGNELFVGNHMPIVNDEPGAGGGFVFSLTENGWQQTLALEVENTPIENTGRQIAQSEDFAIMGVSMNPPDDFENPHRILCYKKNTPSDWELIESFSFPSSNGLDWQGFHMDMKGDWGIIGTAHGLNDDGQVFILDFRAFSNTEPSFDVELSLYPNPVLDKLMVSDREQVFDVLRVYDVQGRQYSSFDLIGETQEISFRDLPAGTYFIELEGADAYTTRQVVKE